MRRACGQDSPASPQITEERRRTDSHQPPPPSHRARRETARRKRRNRDVSVTLIKRHTRSSPGRLAATAGLVRPHLPELGDGAQMVGLMRRLSAGRQPAYAAPPPNLLAADADEPALGAHRTTATRPYRDGKSPMAPPPFRILCSVRLKDTVTSVSFLRRQGHDTRGR